MTAESLGRGISVYEMLRLVGRAGIATKSGSTEEITKYLRQLHPGELVEEFHRAVVVLSERGMLTHEERVALDAYAREWVYDQPMTAERA